MYVYLPVGASLQRKERRPGVLWGDDQRRGIGREEELKEGAEVSCVCTEVAVEVSSYVSCERTGRRRRGVRWLGEMGQFGQPIMKVETRKK